MAESSGFFDATWDETIENPETGELGDWVPRYLVKEFTDYFSLFVGNGVFINPVNQCKVIPGAGLSVIVTDGWAFINGMWYHNDSEKQINLVGNQTGNNRVDSIRLRYNEADKAIVALCFTDDTEITRNDTTYDLKLADVIVSPFVVEVSAANITDTRPDETVCGFVKGLLEVIDTKDLFDQFAAMFTEWFEQTKGQLSGDLAIRIQQELVEVLEVSNNTNQMFKQYMDAHYITDEKYLVFEDLFCEIEDAKITPASLIDVYFTADTIREAERCQIYVDSEEGKIVLTAEKEPEEVIKAVFNVRIR